DANVKAGLAYLADFLANPEPKGNIPNSARSQTMGGRRYYFFWSLERVAVAYNLETINGKDWYGWASGILLKNQGGGRRRAGGDVSCPGGEFPQGGCDTCFALLCLRRANLATDLSELTRSRFKDPNSRELKASTTGVPTTPPGGTTKPGPGKDDKKVEAKPP